MLMFYYLGPRPTHNYCIVSLQETQLLNKQYERNYWVSNPITHKVKFTKTTNLSQHEVFPPQFLMHYVHLFRMERAD